MPAYDYQCNFCQKKWTEYHGFNEDTIKCPFCEQENIKRVYNYVSQINKLEEAMQSKNKTGKKTRDYIEQARQDLKEYKVEQKK